MKAKLTTKEIVSFPLETVERITKSGKKTGRVDIFDDSEKSPGGFGIRITKSGKKTFFLMYRHGGRLKRWTIGRFPQVSLDEARKRARKAHANEQDPAGAKAESRRAGTFEQLAAQFLEAIQKKLRPRTWTEWHRIVTRELIPQFGSMRPDQITRGDIKAFLSEKAKSHGYMANRIFEVIRRLYNWSVKEDKVGASPCVGIERPHAEKERERILSSEEIRSVFKALDAERPLIASFFRVAFLTGARRNEVLNIRWRDMDWDQGLLTLAETKGGRQHLLPLSAEAIRVLESLRPFSGHAEWVFLGPTGKAIANPQKAATRIRKRAGVSFRIHDIRRTVATGLASIGTPREVISAVLGHVQSGPNATRIYERHHRIPEMRSALEAWAAHLGRIVRGETEGAQVVPFARG